jgi:hypothetical protein
MKKRISKNIIRRILTDCKVILKQRKILINAAALNEISETQHTAIILPTKRIKRIPSSNSSLNKIRFILKSGRTPNVILSLNLSKEFSHFTFGKGTTSFVKVLNTFIRQKKLMISDVLVIKAFHSEEYFFQVNEKKQPVKFFVAKGKTFAEIDEVEIIRLHNLNIKQLSNAQRDYEKMKRVAKKEKINHLIKLNYI